MPTWTVDDLLAALPEDAPLPIADGAVLRASWAGSCERVVSYRARGLEPSDPLPLALRFAFAVGHAVHEVVQAGLAAIFPEGEAEKAGSFSIDDGIITVGYHADFWRPGVVTEIKTMQTFAFSKARKEGVQEWHMAQAGIAAIGLKADQVELVYIDKAKGTMDVYAFRRDEWMPAATGALVSMREGLRTAQRIHPERGHWRCRSCEFHTRCGND